MEDKQALRRRLRRARRDHVAALPPSTSALILRRPPAPLLELVEKDAVVGLYHAGESEAPTVHYARFFAEAGHRVALPYMDEEAMRFRRWDNPWSEDELVPGPQGALQPGGEAEDLIPQIFFVPLVGFTPAGARLGQGGGHYDRWLAAHPGARAIGMAWDVQCVETLPTEPHDRPLNAVVTPTRLYGPFARQSA